MYTLHIEAPTLGAAVAATLPHVGQRLTIAFMENGDPWAVVKLSTYGQTFADIYPCTSWGHTDNSANPPTSRRGARFERASVADTRHAAQLVINRARKMYY